MKKLFMITMVFGLFALGISTLHAQDALEQLKAANNGKQDTGTTFDGSSATQGKGTIDTTVQPSSGTATGVSPSSGTASGVAPSSGTAGGYSVAPSSGTTAK